MKKLFLYLNICCLTFFYSCSNQEAIIQKITQMQETPLIVPLTEMEYWEPDEKLEINHIDNNYRLVVYTDSSQCTPCFISHLSDWYELLSLERNGKLNVTFIIEPPSTQYDKTMERINNVQFFHPLYIDSNCKLRKNNPQIPNESMFHTFLLNKNNQIVLVGNPLHNNQIEKMLKEIISN